MLYHILGTLSFNDVHCIKFYCNGCPAQNKNVSLMGMLMQWLYSTKTSVKHIHVIYPIVGHSFLPPDRVFGRIKKDVKKKNTIILPSEYRTNSAINLFKTNKFISHIYKVFMKYTNNA